MESISSTVGYRLARSAAARAAVAGQMFYVIEGLIHVHCSDDTWLAGPRSLAFLPRAVPHGFSVSDDGPGRTLLINELFPV